MYGNVITNRQLRNLIDSKTLTIFPFNDENLKAASYTLNPGQVLRRGDDGEYDVVHSFSKMRSKYVLGPGDYVLVEPRQKIAIAVDGIVGTFIMASTNIENGLLVTAGQIDGRYGTKGEMLRFGVKNLLEGENELVFDTRLVHLQLIDMRGSATDPIRLDPAAQKVWEDRIRNEAWAEANIPNYRNAKE